MNDTKSGKRREVAARLSYTVAWELGFGGSLNDWERLMGLSRLLHFRMCPSKNTVSNSSLRTMNRTEIPPGSPTQRKPENCMPLSSTATPELRQP